MRQIKPEVFTAIPRYSTQAVWRDTVKAVGWDLCHFVGGEIPGKVYVQALAVSASYLKVARCGA